MRQYHLLLPHRESLRAEDFLPSDTNKEALDWLMRQAPETWSSHALILWGPEGSGKTHLLAVWAERMGGLFVTPGDDALEALLEGDGEEAYILDDAEDLAGDPEAEEWLQHFFNATKAARAPFLMAARKAPTLWGLGLRDIETRLKSCQTVEILPPDDDLMRGLLLKLFADRQLMVESGVVDYLAARLDRTGGAVIEAVQTLDEAALETGHKISIPFAQRILFPKDS